MKIGIVGCGIIAEAHVRIIRKLMKNANLFLCDLDRSNTEKLATKFGAQGIYVSLDELLSTEKPDTVHVITPVSSHFTLSEKALRAGCHVYIEKPVTESADEYRKLSEFAKKEGKVICVGYSTIGMPAVLKARNEIASGKLGRLIAVHCDFMCAWPRNVIPYDDFNHWAYSMTGGILQNMADHPASLIVDAMDEVQDYTFSLCQRNVLPNDCLDLLHVTMRNEDQIGSFTLSLGHGCSHWQTQYSLEGGTILVDMHRQLININRGSGPQNFIKRALSGIAVAYAFAGGTISNAVRVVKGSLQKNPGISNLISNFYNTIQGKEELIVHHRTVMQVSRILEEVWRSVNNKSDVGHCRVTDS